MWSLARLFCFLAILVIFRSTIFFDSEKSITFASSLDNFEISYLDGTSLIGKICSDRFRIGDIVLFASFGCVDPNRNLISTTSDLSGILGLGFPLAISGSLKNTNIVFALSQNASKSSKVFTLIIDKKSGGGELQIGGVDISRVSSANINREVTTDILMDCSEIENHNDCSYRHYRIKIRSLRLGNKFLYREETSNHITTMLSGVIDSGTTCLILPSRVGSERVYTDIYGIFMDEMNSIWERGDKHNPVLDNINMPSIFVGVMNQEIEIPYTSYALDASNADMSRYSSANERHDQKGRRSLPLPLCVLTIPSLPDLFLLGDVFMQHAIVVHNLTDENHPTIRLIPRENIDVVKNVEGEITKEHVKRSDDTGTGQSITLSQERNDLIFLTLTSNVLPAPHNRLQKVFQTFPISSRNLSLGEEPKQSRDEIPSSRSLVTSVSLEDLMGIEYIAVVQLGTPFQRNLSVIIDTGSGATAFYTLGTDSRAPSAGYWHSIFHVKDKEALLVAYVYFIILLFTAIVFLYCAYYVVVSLILNVTEYTLNDNSAELSNCSQDAAESHHEKNAELVTLLEKVETEDTSVQGANFYLDNYHHL